MSNTNEPKPAHVRIGLGDSPESTTVDVDGVPQKDVCALALYMSANDAQPARLTLTRLVPPGVAATNRNSTETVVSDSGSLGHITDEYGKHHGDDVELLGVVRLIEAAARTSIADTPGRDMTALHTFLVQMTDEPRASTLADIIRDAERFRTLRKAMHVCSTGIHSGYYFTTSETMPGHSTLPTLDDYVDHLRDKHAQLHEEPRRPT